MAGSTEHEASSDAYGLTRDGAESTRLNDQHTVCQTEIGLAATIEVLTETHSRIKVLQNMPSVSIHAAQQLAKQIPQDGRKRGQDWDEVHNLASNMSSIGFEYVPVDILSSDRVASTRDGSRGAIIGTLAGMMQVFVKANGEASCWDSEGAQLHADAAPELADGKA